MGNFGERQRGISVSAVNRDSAAPALLWLCASIALAIGDAPDSCPATAAVDSRMATAALGAGAGGYYTQGGRASSGTR